MDKKWYRINFKIRLDQNSSPQFFIDLIIIDLLIKPTIEEFKGNIEFWSFHRSFHGEDMGEGQRLKFNFYTTPETAEKILNFIKNIKFYTIIKDNFLDTNHVKEINLEFVGTEGNSEKIEAISDAEWPIEIQRSWPYYINGVCKMSMWLLAETKKRYPNEINDGDPTQLKEYYQKIKDDIDRQWKDYGVHAFFHHLWAIFSYENKLDVFINNSNINMEEVETKFGKKFKLHLEDIFYI